MYSTGFKRGLRANQYIDRDFKNAQCSDYKENKSRKWCVECKLGWKYYGEWNDTCESRDCLRYHRDSSQCLLCDKNTFWSAIEGTCMPAVTDQDQKCLADCEFCTDKGCVLKTTGNLGNCKTSYLEVNGGAESCWHCKDGFVLNQDGSQCLEIPKDLLDGYDGCRISGSAHGINSGEKVLCNECKSKYTQSKEDNSQCESIEKTQFGSCAECAPGFEAIRICQTDSTQNCSIR